MFILGCANEELHKEHNHEKFKCYHTDTELDCYDHGYTHKHLVRSHTHTHDFVEHEHYRLVDNVWVELQ